MDEQHIDLILRLTQQEASEGELFDTLGWTAGQQAARVADLLTHALEEHDADAVEMGVMLAYHFGLSTAFTDIFTHLLAEDWHIKHEDLAFALGKLKATQAIQPLYEAAQTTHDYLAYDDNEALASKCIRALEQIQSPESLQRLWQLAEHERDFIRIEARAALVRHGA